MRTELIGVFAVALLCSCGVNENTFAEEFVATYCEQWEACGTAGDATGGICPASVDAVTWDWFGGDEDGSCGDFKQREAKNCLDTMRWECVDGVDGEMLPYAPEACGCICGACPIF